MTPRPLIRRSDVLEIPRLLGYEDDRIISIYIDRQEVTVTYWANTMDDPTKVTEVREIHE